tara:strand:+ start:426 stop:1040 length:615 start_codon:yes stop_codon:yes gene_type:complete
MRTSSEIETVSKRATRAAGFTWGMSEEVGKCIKALELYKISGLENLYNYLTEIKDKEPFGPLKIDKDIFSEQGNLCPIYTGVALVDSAHKVEEFNAITIKSLDFPILLIPFLNRLSYKIGKIIEVSFDDFEILLNLNNYISSNLDLRNKILKSTSLLTINVIENIDTFDEKIWDKMYKLSTDTFVEESERLKANAAGAGLADND